MATRKRNSDTQTDTDIVQVQDSDVQTGPTPYQATSNTYSVARKEEGDAKRTVTPLTTPYYGDNFGWWEEGRASQTDPMRGKVHKYTQTSIPKNKKKWRGHERPTKY